MTTITDLLVSAATEWPGRPFLRMREGELTYAEVEEQSARLASGLIALGVRPGSGVALLMENSIDQVVTWFALNRIGAVHIPLNTALTGRFLVHAMTVAEATVMIVDERLTPALDAVRGDVPLLETVVVRAPEGRTDDPASFESLRSGTDRAPVEEVEELFPATLLFTSGTTGPSKACVLSHRYLVRQGQLHARYEGLVASDVLYCPFPLFHIDAATLTVVAALSIGAVAALGRAFSASGFWDEVRALDATVFNFMGATLAILWKQEESPGDRDHRVRLGWGVPMPEWQVGFEQRFGLRLRQVYGSTDAGIPVYDPVDGPQRPGAAGRVVDEFDVRITDPLGASVPPGEVGEIRVRGREPGLVMSGYHGMPEATESTIVDGWVRTGDLGSLDSDGYLSFRGRSNDSIRRRGENISAYEVEEMVHAHPDVLEVAAVGVPSELSEEDVKVVVVVRPGRVLTARGLHEFCRATAPAHMVPRYIEIVHRLPKTPTQKIEKFRLRNGGNGPGTWDSTNPAAP